MPSKNDIEEEMKELEKKGLIEIGEEREVYRLSQKTASNIKFLVNKEDFEPKEAIQVIIEAHFEDENVQSTNAKCLMLYNLLDMSKIKNVEEGVSENVRRYIR